VTGRRHLELDLDGLLRTLSSGGRPDSDEITARILDAAADLFLQHGIRRCTVEDIAQHSGLGRTTVYRRFDGRSQIVTAVLARECRRFFTSIVFATAHLETIEDMVVEGFLTGLESRERATLSVLVRNEPELLRVVTVDGAPLLAAATSVLVGAFGHVEREVDRRRVEVVAEVLVRLAMSFVLDGRSVVPLDDRARARADLHALLDPLLEPLGELRDRGRT